jgi:hypothetical protein
MEDGLYNPAGQASVALGKIDPEQLSVEDQVRYWAAVSNIAFYEAAIALRDEMEALKGRLPKPD